jgi:hypothetical protein
MKPVFYFLFSFGLILTGSFAIAQQSQTWPKIVTLKDNSQLKVYEPQPESFSGNLLKVRSAISYLGSGKTDPVFGVLWADVSTEANGGTLRWQQLNVTNLKLPAENTGDAFDNLEAQIEEQVSNWNLSISKTELDQKLKLSTSEVSEANKLSTAPPAIIYSAKPAILVFVDGEPQIQQNPDWGVEQVVNTPFTILRTQDQNFYLYGNKRWYRSNAINGPWSGVSSVPSALSKAATAIREADTSKVSATQTPATIIVSQKPAELVQSDGEANFAPLQGTNLLYMTNSSNDVFLDVSSQQYYVLLSGRWYKAKNLSSNWTYTSADKLPVDFAKIPENSVKSNVLASVAGTDAASESVAEAQVPQTAKVDRKTATASVTYDGDPQFEDIDGTDLRYGVNSSGQVLQSGRTYFYVENGVWFRASSATGPWVVATERPAGVEYIPASYPVYNLKYVNIYDVYQDYVYMGYTPGYLGNYVYGPTIVYGTGYYYRPWRGRYYYPRPVTWGFNMRYNPWVGWSFGYSNWNSWFFNIDLGFRNRRAPICWGGWWGPSVYRPAYYRNYPSYYGRSISYNDYRFNSYRSNNVYRYRRDVVTSDRLYRYSPSNGRNNYSYNYRSNQGVTRPDRNYSRPSAPYNNTPGNYNNTNGRTARPANTNRPSGSINNGNWNNGSRPNGRIERGQAEIGSNRPSGSINNGNWNNGTRPALENGNRPVRTDRSPAENIGNRPYAGNRPIDENNNGAVNRPVGGQSYPSGNRPIGANGEGARPTDNRPISADRPQRNYEVPSQPQRAPERAPVPQRNNEAPAQPQRNYETPAQPQRAPVDRPQRTYNPPAQQRAPERQAPAERPQMGSSRPQRSPQPSGQEQRGGNEGGRESRRRG